MNKTPSDDSLDVLASFLGGLAVLSLLVLGLFIGNFALDLQNKKQECYTLVEYENETGIHYCRYKIEKDVKVDIVQNFNTDMPVYYLVSSKGDTLDTYHTSFKVLQVVCGN
jgi:hypothetical protein